MLFEVLFVLATASTTLATKADDALIPGDGINLETTGLVTYLQQNFGVSSVDDIPVKYFEYPDHDDGIDIMFLVDSSYRSMMRPEAEDMIYAPRLFLDFLRSRYPQHRVGIAHYNNKPLPNKAPGLWGGWRFSDYLWQHGNCYGLHQNFLPLNESESYDVLAYTIEHMWYQYVWPLDMQSDGLGAILTTIADPALEWRPAQLLPSDPMSGTHRPRLLVAFPKYPLEVVGPDTPSLQFYVDNLITPYYPDHCGEAVGYGSDYLYEEAFAPPMFPSYDALMRVFAKQCAGETPTATDVTSSQDWLETGLTPLDITLAPFSFDVLKTDQPGHCRKHEYPLTTDILDLWQDDSVRHGYRVAFIYDKDTGPELAAPFGSQFVSDNDLQHFPALVQSGNQDELEQIFEKVLKWGTAVVPVEMTTTTTTTRPTTTTTTTEEPTTTTEEPSTTTEELTTTTTEELTTTTTEELTTTTTEELTTTTTTEELTTTTTEELTTTTTTTEELTTTTAEEPTTTTTEEPTTTTAEELTTTTTTEEPTTTTEEFTATTEEFTATTEEFTATTEELTTTTEELTTTTEEFTATTEELTTTTEELTTTMEDGAASTVEGNIRVVEKGSVKTALISAGTSAAGVIGLVAWRLVSRGNSLDIEESQLEADLMEAEEVEYEDFIAEMLEGSIESF